MDADFSIELGRDDPVLDFPWEDPTGKLVYVDLKRRPELLASIEEIGRFPELGEFLRELNSPRTIVETAKCDAWATTELSADETYLGTHKFVSYVDVVFSGSDLHVSSLRQSFSAHEQFAKKLVERLSQGAETPSAVEICVRRCYFGADKGDVREGLYWSLYVSGFGNDSASARENWETGLEEMRNAVVELSAPTL
jgi:hypothetical protein